MNIAAAPANNVFKIVRRVTPAEACFTFVIHRSLNKKIPFVINTPGSRAAKPG
jgi:hypothetical protein